MFDDMPNDLYFLWVLGWTLIGIVIIPCSSYWIYECYQEMKENKRKKEIKKRVQLISLENYKKYYEQKSPLLIKKTTRNYNNYYSINH